MQRAIHSIDKKSIHKICSGQVIEDVPSAVKELIENSLDANATEIHIQLHDSGFESIEVSDNGCGIHSSNFEKIGKRHCTSKIQAFDDLLLLQTFGFRGEAIHSLCIVGTVEITTKHEDDPTGSKLEFNKQGDLIQKTPVQKVQTGTTVTVRNLFKCYPVRLQELTKNKKQQFIKCLHWLNGYCLMATGIRFKFFHKQQVSPSKTRTVRSNELILETFGCGKMEDNIKTIFGPSILTQLNEISGTIDGGISLQGFLSKPASSKSRGSGDRHFLFLNRRPIEAPKIVRVIQELYKFLYGRECTIIILNFSMDTTNYDVNVVPNKRKIFIHSEDSFLQSFRNFLESYMNLRSNNTINDTTQLVNTSSPVPSPAKLQPVQQQLTTPKTISATPSSIQTNLSKTSPYFKTTSNSSSSSTPQPSGLKRFLNGSKKTQEPEELQEEPEPSLPFFSSLSASQDFMPICEDDYFDLDEPLPSVNLDSDVSSPPSSFEKPPAVIKTDEEILQRICRRNTTMKMTVDIQQIAKSLYLKRSSSANTDSDLDITNDAPAPETTEQKVVKREDFQNMKVVGQFNAGFIIAKKERDLYIIDQHAADEKFNFEQLVKNATVKSQPLLMPLDLQLTAEEEELMIEYKAVFEKNGFVVHVDENMPPMQRVCVAAVPFSKKGTLGTNEIYELLNMIRESGKDAINYRLSRIVSSFASRACRKSVMVGKVLNQQEMKRILENMSRTQHPWFCPHGRPTAQHVLNLDVVP